MRAIQITSHEGPDGLKLVDVAEPLPNSEHVLIEVKAAGVAFPELLQTRGAYQVSPPLPFVPGTEVAGVVINAPADSEFSPGDRVGWSSSLGSFSQFTLIAAERAVRVPEAVDLEIAAAVLLQGMTAHYLAHDTFPMAAGHRCLIHAGAGGVGLLLTQMAKRIGADVITTVGSEDKVELSRGAGAGPGVISHRAQGPGEARRDHHVVAGQFPHGGAAEAQQCRVDSAAQNVEYVLHPALPARGQPP